VAIIVYCIDKSLVISHNRNLRGIWSKATWEILFRMWFTMWFI